MRTLLREKAFWHATAVLTGAMVGVGIYGIPFVFVKAGVGLGLLWLVALGGATLVFSMLFAELTLSTQGVHQVVGYANIWLGPWGRRLMLVTTIIAVYGGLLAYLIIAGEFLHNILSQFFAVDPQYYSIAFALLWSGVWIARVRAVAAVEIALIGLYTLIIGIMGITSVGHFSVAHWTWWNGAEWYLPYGVLLFALAGANAIPIQRQLLSGGKERLFRPAIIAAIVFTAVLYGIFALTVTGVSGDATSPDAIAGLYGILGEPIIILGSLLGILTISTSYVMLGTSLYETFTLDYRIKPLLAWLFGIVPPVLLFWSGLRNFIDLITLVGAVSVGLQLTLLLAASLRSRRLRLRTPEFHARIPIVFVWVLMAVFMAGVLYQLILR